MTEKLNGEILQEEEETWSEDRPRKTQSEIKVQRALLISDEYRCVVQ